MRSEIASPISCILTSFVFSLVGPDTAGAQDRGLTLEAGIERSSVTIDESEDTWGTDYVQLGYRAPETGGAFFVFERQTRFGQVDTVFRGSGYRRLGDWTVSGELGLTANADFYYRQSVEGELSKRIVGTLVGHVQYRYLNFPSARVQVVSPAATFYFAKGELHGRLYLVRNSTLELDSQSFLVRGLYELNDRLRFGGGFAAGERIFDITFLPGVPAEGWLVYGDALVRVGGENGIGVRLGFAHEEPYFNRLSLGAYYRRWF